MGKWHTKLCSSLDPLTLSGIKKVPTYIGTYKVLTTYGYVNYKEHMIMHNTSMPSLLDGI